MSVLKVAIAGDLHGSWNALDHEILLQLNPDCVLFVGDLGEGDIRLIKAINLLPFPTAVILGNHDRGVEYNGSSLQNQLTLLGDRDCSWRLREWKQPNISVVGARPCSSGGGYFLSPQVKSVFGEISLDDSVARIVNAANKASDKYPLILLAHSGPTGLGSEASSICGRDWKLPSIDWGDRDLAIAIDQIRKTKKIDLVVFGHMHHHLRRNQGIRRTYFLDNFGTFYLNTACVPRCGLDKTGELLTHFSWIEFSNGILSHVSHRWYKRNASIAFQENLFNGY